MTAPILKQLKKNDFLNAITTEPITREQIMNALEGYHFISSYLDYLIDHFVEQGKIIDNGDGTYTRIIKKTSSAAKEMYRVVHRDEATAEHPEGFSLESSPYNGLMTKQDLDAGWSVTKGAAVKKACSHIHTVYKNNLNAVKDLLK